MQTKISAKNVGRILLVLAFGLAICVGLFASANGATAGVPTAGIPTANQASKIDPTVLQDTANGKSTSVMVLLADQANVDAANSMKDQDARGWYVYNTLTQHALKTQGPLRAALNARGVTYTSFWAVNSIEVTVDRTLLETLAARSDVSEIESNKPTRWIEDPKIANLTPANASPNVVEWGVQRVNAPQVWALGYTGQGIVIGNEDTGMQWDHPALKPHYRGWNGTTADHNYNWHDSIHSGGGSCGPDTMAPCDDSGHGTHTTGTTSGDDGAGNQIGVAPGAKWIGCRNMNVGNGTPASYTECFQFFIAPTDLSGNNPNPALRPHVINNSWGCPASEGCTTRAELETIVNNTQAAGIFVEASAGNSGPGCSTVSDPPSIYDASFSTGAIDINNTLASFSSRGPSTYYTPNLLKPNISAPGVNNRSAYPTNTYASLSGTSMAGPHVVGVVALLWSARPQLVRDIATTKTILENTANPNVVVSPVQTCGGIPSSTIPNNSFGYGRVDALAAVNSVPQATATPTGTGTQPTATRTSTPTNTPIATPTSCGASAPYAVATATGTIVAGTVDTGNHCDDCTTTITVPFPVTLYGQTCTSLDVDSNGMIHCVLGQTSNFTNACLPDATYTYTIFPYWDDLYTVNSGFGIFTSILGSAPNRIFNIEWRAQYFPGSGTANFEVQLYEGQSRFDVIFGTLTNGSGSATIGVQKDTTNFTQYICNTAGVASGLQLIFTRPPCATGTPATSTNTPVLPTATRTNTAAVATSTQTNTVTAPTSTRTNTAVPPTSTNTVIALTSTRTNTVAIPTATRTNTVVAPSPTTAGATATCVPAGGIQDVAISSFAFTPPDVTIPAGTTIRWTNTGGTHTTTSDTGVWDSGVLAVDGQFSFTFNTPGTYSYHCSIHPALMTGTITVLPASPCATATSIPTNPPPTATTHPLTPTPVATNTTGPTITPGGPTETPTETPIPTETATACTITFSDVPPDHPFYTWIRCLACRGIISGYSDNTFRPGNDITRGQIAKMVSKAAGFEEDPGPQIYEDVAPGSPFYDWINRLTNRGYMGGYDCGLVPEEPCVPPGNRPYFRPSANATRGQLSKIVSNAAGLGGTPTGTFYTDVPEGHPFYLWIMRLTDLGVMSGYPCGGAGEPCDDQQRPYFRPFNNVTRGQASKIVANTFLPDCQTPSHR